MKLINVDIYQLNEKLKNKKLVCFGAGRMLLNFTDRFGQDEFAKKILVILDNDKKKQNTSIKLYDQSIDIISVEKFCTKYHAEDHIILIMLDDAVSVFEQLQQIRQLKDVECCMAMFVRGKTNEIDERNRCYPTNLRVYDKPIIPKVIHYCWFGGKEIPEQNKVWMESWKKYCPDYEIVEWNESNYDIKKNTYMYEAYQAKKWGFVSDYVELDVIYQHGGIYLDTDVEIIRNLDELLYQDAFVGVDGSRNISLGLGFGAIPKFQLIKELMDEYNDRSFYSTDGTIDITAAPTLQIPFFQKLGYVNNGEYQKIGGLSIYPEKVLSGKCNYTGTINPTKDTFLIHHYDGSWAADERKMRIKKMHELYKEICDREQDERNG